MEYAVLLCCIHVTWSVLVIVVCILQGVRRVTISSLSYMEYAVLVSRVNVTWSALCYCRLLCYKDYAVLPFLL
jgi:hypothetical protein